MGIGVEQIRGHYARHISSDAFITEAPRYQRKTGAVNKASAIKELLTMVESGVIDDEAALAAIKRVSQQTSAS